MGSAYRRIYGRMTGRPTNFGWVEENRIAGCGRPTSRKEVQWLILRGIDSLISLTEQPLSEEIVGDLHLNYFHFHLRNHEAPVVDQVKKVIKVIEEQLKGGSKVAVHCAAGLGRTGTILAAFLMKTKGLTAEEAVRTVRELRPGSIEENQVPALREYERFIGKEDN